MDANLNGVKVSKPSMQQELQPAFSVLKISSESLEDKKEKNEFVKQIEKKDIEDAVKKMNAFLEPHNTTLHYKFHEKLQKYYVTIVDSSTNQVIKEIPPKKFLDIYASHLELLGLITDHKI